MQFGGRKMIEFNLLINYFPILFVLNNRLLNNEKSNGTHPQRLNLIGQVLPPLAARISEETYNLW